MDVFAHRARPGTWHCVAQAGEQREVWDATFASEGDARAVAVGRAAWLDCSAQAPRSERIAELAGARAGVAIDSATVRGWLAQLRPLTPGQALWIPREGPCAVVYGVPPAADVWLAHVPCPERGFLSPAHARFALAYALGAR